MTPASDRIAALDLVRGVAVLGILAVNIAGFAGPQFAVTTPDYPSPGSALDHAAFALSFVLFEGKMRALFTMLFGASMVLFLERAEAAGREAPALQFRRLGWLALFGYLHFALIWWGDILFAYAFCGLFALACWRAPPRLLAILAVAIFVLWHLQVAIGSLPEVTAEEQVRIGTASVEQAEKHHLAMIEWTDRAAAQLEDQRGSWSDLVRNNLTLERFRPLAQAIVGFCETLPLMLLGMALFRSGFFTEGWSRQRLLLTTVGGVAIGGALTLAALLWALPRHFPPILMNALMSSWLALPHLLMAMGYAAALMLAGRFLLGTAIGRALCDAGRTAFTNYIGTSLVMTALFYGWGLGLAGTVGAAAQWLFVLFGWALMLIWSKVWLVHFRQGPLEWLWRSLTEWRLMEVRR